MVLKCGVTLRLGMLGKMCYFSHFIFHKKFARESFEFYKRDF